MGLSLEASLVYAHHHCLISNETRKYKQYMVLRGWHRVLIVLHYKHDKCIGCMYRGRITLEQIFYSLLDFLLERLCMYTTIVFVEVETQNNIIIFLEGIQ